MTDDSAEMATGTGDQTVFTDSDGTSYADGRRNHLRSGPRNVPGGPDRRVDTLGGGHAEGPYRDEVLARALSDLASIDEDALGGWLTTRVRGGVEPRAPGTSGVTWPSQRIAAGPGGNTIDG